MKVKTEVKTIFSQTDKFRSKEIYEENMLQSTLINKYKDVYHQMIYLFLPHLKLYVH